MSSSKEKPTVYRIVKKKKGKHGFHGGAWKIAFADFMTAMMAFFMVLWIISMDEKVKHQIQGYFNDPTGKSQMLAGGMGPHGNLSSEISISALSGIRKKQRNSFESVKERLEEVLRNDPDFKAVEDYVEITLTDEGLIIELLDAEESFFFESGKAEIKAKAQKLLRLIARELGALPNPVVLEGHTDAAVFRTATEYTNWELSADRANAARRIMEDGGLQDKQVVEVRGYAAMRLRKPEQPTHYSNRRVSILARYTDDAAPWYARKKNSETSESKPGDQNEDLAKQEIKNAIEVTRKQ